MTDRAFVVLMAITALILVVALIAVGGRPTPTPTVPTEPPPIVHRVETPERVCYVVTYADTLLTLGCDARGDTDGP